MQFDFYFFSSWYYSGGVRTSVKSLDADNFPTVGICENLKLTLNCIFWGWSIMILTWVSPHIVECICQIVTPGWLSWGQAGLTSALLALWPELRPGAGGQDRHSSRDIVTLHITLCWPAEILYTLRPVSGSRVIVSVFLKADTAPSQVPRPHQWL